MGFARLLGAESARRAPTTITTVEDALAALVQNALDAGARNVFVASHLRSRRYRNLTVLDDGAGIPPGFEERVFEPGVTSRHLDPARDPSPRGPRSGLSLHHVRATAISAAVLSRADPTSVRAVFDTDLLPERSLQTRPHDRSARPTRASRSNLSATLTPFLTAPEAPRIHHSSPSRILATLLSQRIIHPVDSHKLYAEAHRLGLEVSLRTVQRVLGGSIPPAVALRRPTMEGPAMGSPAIWGPATGGSRARTGLSGGGELRLGREETLRIQAILEDAARARYLEVGPLRAEARAGAIVLRASVYEPEEIYDDR